MTTKQQIAKRLGELEAGIRQHHEALWASFSLEELEGIKNGDAKALAKFERLDGYKICALFDEVMTRDERAEINQIIKELKLDS